MKFWKMSLLAIAFAVAACSGFETNREVRANAVFRRAIVETDLAHSCAVTPEGALYCWGDNSVGQLGAGSLPFSVSALKIFDSGVTAVSLGPYNSCAIS